MWTFQERVSRLLSRNLLNFVKNFLRIYAQIHNPNEFFAKGVQFFEACFVKESLRDQRLYIYRTFLEVIMSMYDANPNAIHQEATTWVHVKMAEILGHSAWRGQCNQAQSEQLLKNSDAFTFILRPGKDMCNYWLSFVNEARQVEHRAVRIEQERNAIVFYNGGQRGCTDISTLVPYAMHCSSSECIPYQNLV